MRITEAYNSCLLAQPVIFQKSLLVEFCTGNQSLSSTKPAGFSYALLVDEFFTSKNLKS
jgi:hypothetical protein